MEEELQQTEQQEAELILQVFQYSDYDYVIGLVDLDQINSSDFAMTINHVLALVFDEEEQNYRIFEDTIVNSSRVYNLSKHKVIAMFTPSEFLAEEYFELAYRISERNNFTSDESDEEDDQDLKNYIQIGQIQ